MEHFVEEKADENTLRVMVATDNHLGLMEDDPVRGDDSFRTFEEILKLARECQVDALILAGDLFHINRPTRSTMAKTMGLLRKYCFGERDVDIVVRGKFAHESGSVNFEDENVSVDLPIFAIHGNHDNPTRDGVSLKALSALDILSEARLINYFGCSDSVEGLEVEPVLIEKGLAKLKLYGMGWIRDERMHHLFSSEKVMFKMSPEELENDDVRRAWFNMLLVHQNRENKGRSSKACFRESFIPDFMDLVIFGHEHECFIDPQESGMSESVRLSQPGSSVRTSLSDSEREVKHIAVMEISLSQEEIAPKMAFTKIPLRSVRPFEYDEMTLSTFADEIRGSEGEKLEIVEKILDGKVREMIRSGRADYKAMNPGASDSEVKRVLPLIRLRVEYSGFQPINSQRFASKFSSKVANPNDLLSWYKKRQVVQRQESQTGDIDLEELALELQESRQDTTQQINQLVEGILKQSSDSLSLVPEKELNDSIFSFVSTDQTAKIIELYIDELLEFHQRRLLDNNAVDADKVDDMNSLLAKSKEIRNKAAQQKQDEANAGTGNSLTDMLHAQARGDDREDDEDNILSDSDEENLSGSHAAKSRSKARTQAPPLKKRAGATGNGTRGGKRQKVVEEKTPSKAKRKTSKKTAFKEQSESDASSDGRSKPTVPAKRPRRAAAKVKKVVETISDEASENSDSEYSQPKKGRGAKKSSKRSTSSKVIALDESD